MADQVETIKLVRENHVSYSQIEEDLGITKNWLTRFVNYNIIHVDQRIVDCLYKYLMREKKHREKQARKCEGK